MHLSCVVPPPWMSLLRRACSGIPSSWPALQHAHACARLHAAAGDAAPSSPASSVSRPATALTAAAHPADSAPPSLRLPHIPAADLPLLSQRWEQRRLTWLVTGSSEVLSPEGGWDGGGQPGGAAGGGGEPAVGGRDAGAQLTARLKARRGEVLAARRPVRINAKGILAVMGDPARASATITFTKPLPLRQMVGICLQMAAWSPP